MTLRKFLDLVVIVVPQINGAQKDILRALVDVFEPTEPRIEPRKRRHRKDAEVVSLTKDAATDRRLQ
jgi:hypothetical protein